MPWLSHTLPQCYTHHRGRCTIYYSPHHAATTGLSTLSLHDALPIYSSAWAAALLEEAGVALVPGSDFDGANGGNFVRLRSEEHTSELQSRGHLVCRLLLEKKKQGREQGQESPKLQSRSCETANKPRE